MTYTGQTQARAGTPSDEAKATAIPGHELTPMLWPADCDSSEGYVQCSCGWWSRTVKSCNLDKVFAEHVETSRKDRHA